MGRGYRCCGEVPAEEAAGTKAGGRTDAASSKNLKFLASAYLSEMNIMFRVLRKVHD